VGEFAAFVQVDCALFLISSLVEEKKTAMKKKWWRVVKCSVYWRSSMGPTDVMSALAHPLLPIFSDKITIAMATMVKIAPANTGGRMETSKDG
jgi:hypothetical protein